MSLADLSLAELAAFVSEHLRASGADVVVVGGSAITSWAPAIYTSSDVDFAVTNGMNRRKLSVALAQIGFKPSGRIFAHADCRYTLDFVATTPYIDGRPVVDFAEIQTSCGPVRVYRLRDAIADRVAHFVHWSDNEALNVAEQTVWLARQRLHEALREAPNAYEP